MSNTISIDPPSDQLARGESMKIPIVLRLESSIKVRGIHSRFHAAEETKATYTTTSTDSKGRTTTTTHTAVEQVTIDHDLLVMGATPSTGLFSLLRGTRKDRLTEHAACSVLRLKTHRGSLHRVLSRASTEETTEFKGVAQRFSPEHSAAQVDAAKKSEVFENFAATFARTWPLPTQGLVNTLKAMG